MKEIQTYMSSILSHKLSLSVRVGGREQWRVVVRCVSKATHQLCPAHNTRPGLQGFDSVARTRPRAGKCAGTWV